MTKSAPALLWSALIAIASLARFSPPREIPGFFEHADKLAHFGMYAIYAFIMLRCALFAARGALRAITLTITWAFAYGFLMECLQGLIPWVQRDFSVLDLTANVLGAGVGAWAWNSATDASGRSAQGGLKR